MIAKMNGIEAHLSAVSMGTLRSLFKSNLLPTIVKTISEPSIFFNSFTQFFTFWKLSSSVLNKQEKNEQWNIYVGNVRKSTLTYHTQVEHHLMSDSKLDRVHGICVEKNIGNCYNYSSNKIHLLKFTLTFLVPLNIRKRKRKIFISE